MNLTLLLAGITICLVALGVAVSVLRHALRGTGPSTMVLAYTALVLLFLVATGTAVLAEGR